MKKIQYSNNDEWLDDRKGRITGTRAGNLVSKRDGHTKLAGFYELLKEQIAIPPTNENVMDRGHRLEETAIIRFTEKTSLVVNTDLVLWVREDEERIAVSPDGAIINEDGISVGAVEVKCKSSQEFIEMYLKQTIPGLHKDQALQYFVVNDDLKILYFVYYDPRMPIDIFWITVRREEVQEEISKALQQQKEILAQVDALEKQFTF